MGREAVGVEIDQEYLGWGPEASERVQEEIGRSFHVLWADASTIGNLLCPSSVDVVVKGSPYVLTSLHAGDPERRLERVLRTGGDPRDFFGSMARNSRDCSRSSPQKPLGQPTRQEGLEVAVRRQGCRPQVLG
jgi:hypothetical protein